MEARCKVVAEEEGGKAHPFPQGWKSLSENRAITSDKAKLCCTSLRGYSPLFCAR